MKQYHKNPRQITDRQFEQLGDNLAELGDLSGIVHDLNSDEITHIYTLVRCSDSHPFYVGKSNDTQKRLCQHKAKAEAGTSSHVYNYIRKLWREGDDFDIAIILDVPMNEWGRFEQGAIEAYRNAGIRLTNITEGGCSPEMRPETRAKLSNALTGRKFSQRHRENLSAAKKGKAPWNKGRKSNRESPMKNPETAAKVSAALKGRVMGDEWRKKLSDAKKGRTPHNKGQRGIVGKPVYMLDAQTGEVVNRFPSVTAALDAIGKTSLGSISECANGKRKTAYGYKWSYHLDERTTQTV